MTQTFKRNLILCQNDADEIKTIPSFEAGSFLIASSNDVTGTLSIPISENTAGPSLPVPPNPTQGGALE
jgi:hypothetical protein